MLKIRTLIIALAFSPLIAISWQLTNQAGANSPSKGQAGSGSGGATPPINYHPSPSKGQAGSGSGGANNGGNSHSSPSKGQAGSGSGSQSDDFTVEKKSDGIEIRLSPEARDKLKTALPINNGLLSPSATQTLLNSLELSGLSKDTARNLIRTIKEILKSTPANTPHSSLLELKQGQLVASTKAIKPDTSMAEKNTVITVNTSKLNEAINLYNEIVMASDSETLKKLSQNPEFVEIGQALKELKSVIK